MQQQHHHSEHDGLVHISVAVRRIRNRLARLIATRDQVFSSDMSIELDRLLQENEQLRAREVA